MKVLIAEDNPDTRFYYDILFEKYQHVLVSAKDGLECLKIYHDEFENVRLLTDAMQKIQPFDAVILDYKMPGRNGLEVAKEILAVNPHQRIIFASAYVRDILMEAVRQLRQLVELVQKPFSERQFIDILEDTEVYQELGQLGVDVNQIKKGQFRHEQLKSLLETLNELGRHRD
ncbi:MAG TPA: response regulator [Nitrososphaeraceae archaeon]|nr:response regulator [Nitrososphaeraceae archaeon]